jgi:hypothetical protein
MPWWAPAPPCHNAQAVSAVMYVRCSTVHSSWGLAFKAARPFSRWRPESAVTTQRGQHQRIPRKGAKTTWAASMRKTARRPAWASAPRGAQQFFQRVLGLHVRLGRDHPDCSRPHPERVQKLSHLRRPARTPGQGVDSGRDNGGGRPLLTVGLDPRAVSVEEAAWPMWLNVLEWRDAPPSRRP